MNEQNCIAPNECSTRRWIVTLVVGFVLATVTSLPFYPLMQNTTDSFMGIPFATLFTVISFIPQFICILIAIKFIAKTPIKNFLFGNGGEINKKSCLIVFVLFIIGFYLPLLISLENVKVNQVDVGHFCFALAFFLVTIFIQTTFEELIFRGIFIRCACKNNIGYSKRAWIAYAICSVLFAVSHASNPEVTSQQGIEVVFSLVAYIVPATAYFIADLHFGSLLPGIIMHWANNFMLSTIVNGEISALNSSVLLTDTSPTTGASLLLSSVLTHAPIFIYIIIDCIRRKMAASKSAK